MLAVFLLSFLVWRSSALCCNYGQSSETAGLSCSDILRFSPGCHDLSGYYWIEMSNGSTVQIYCDMKIDGGGWERVVYYNSAIPAMNCPGNMVAFDLLSYHLCTNNRGLPNITMATYYPVTSTYSQVMGLVTAYVSDEPHGFYPKGSKVVDLNTVYMDGISVTISDASGFHKHIHSTAVADWINAFFNRQQSCFVLTQDPALPPHVVGKDNTCTLIYYLQFMPLDGSIYPYTSYFGDYWLGACTVFSQFCRFPHRYFIKYLPVEYTSQDNPLVVRVMSQSDIVIAMNYLEIYVR